MRVVQNEHEGVEAPLGARRSRPDPCVIVVFGASGDLARRKLFPALYSLAYRRLLPRDFGLVGVARTQQSTAQFHAAMKEAVQEFGRDPFRQDVWEELEEAAVYISADAEGKPGAD